MNVSVTQSETVTYNTQPVEIRSHSFALYFPPEGDFAPEAHCRQNYVQFTVLNEKKKEIILD